MSWRKKKVFLAIKNVLTSCSCRTRVITTDNQPNILLDNLANVQGLCEQLSWKREENVGKLLGQSARTANKSGPLPKTITYPA